MRLDDFQHSRGRTLVIDSDRLPEPRVADKLEVLLGYLEARLRQCHLQVLDQRSEERPVAEQSSQLVDIGVCER